MSKSAFQQFKQEGYLIYPQIFCDEELAKLREACEHVRKMYAIEKDKLAGGISDFHVIRHLNDPRWFEQRPELFKVIMEAVSDPRVLGPVEQIFKGESLFRTTSLFVSPRLESKDGDWHRDSQFANSEEAEKEILKRIRDAAQVDALQLQIPLIDNEDIEYVPYSANRYDSPEEYAIRLSDNKAHNREEGMPNAIRMKLNAGDGLIFNPYGLHRGRYHAEKPRLTFMLTYTSVKEPFYDTFSTQPWCLDENYLAHVSTRCKAYFEMFIKQYKDFWTSQNAENIPGTKE